MPDPDRLLKRQAKIRTRWVQLRKHWHISRILTFTPQAEAQLMAWIITGSADLDAPKSDLSS